MPTYTVGPATPDRRRPLACEQCGAAIGTVQAVAAYTGLPARLILKNWPDVADLVRRHEADCLCEQLAQGAG